MAKKKDEEEAETVTAEVDLIAEPVEEAEDDTKVRHRHLMSKSKRTTIEVEMGTDGTALVTVDRDGHRVHRIDVSREPIPND